NENNSSNEFNINKASSLVSQLTRDNSVSTKSRENRWKLDENTTLCDYQFYIFSHVEASHVVYHIASEDISNDEEVEE
ncbi:12036_t:CDS:2, partial [Racocetra fulgida]